jgi:hypothetical protein
MANVFLCSKASPPGGHAAKIWIEDALIEEGSLLG